MLQKMPLQPGFLRCQLASELGKTGYLAGWMHTRSLAPPLRTRLDGTTPNIWPPIHTNSLNPPTKRPQIAAWKYKNELEATSQQNLAIDGVSHE